MLNEDVCEFFCFEDKRVPILIKYLVSTLIKQIIIHCLKHDRYY